MPTDKRASRAVEATTSNVGDAHILPVLLDQIPSDQNIGSVTADGAYDTHKCHDGPAAHGANAVILRGLLLDMRSHGAMMFRDHSFKIGDTLTIASIISSRLATSSCSSR